jgi:UDP-3-O-[3-hydroxymyristoyl] glucosamine N-acyltransferase
MLGELTRPERPSSESASWEREVDPRQHQKADDDGRPVPLRMKPWVSTEIAYELGFEHRGDARDVERLTGLPPPSDGRGCLVYFEDVSYAQHLASAQAACVVTTADLVDKVPVGMTVLVAHDRARNAFYDVHEAAVFGGRFQKLRAHASASARVAPSAVIGANVYIDDDAQVGACATLLPNTYIGPGAIVKPNAVIGGDGLEITGEGSRRRVVAHAGGCWLEANSQIGSCTCVDAGLFGDFTYIGRGTILDNLIHFAHSASALENCTLVACAEVSGSVRLGQGVWIGPSSAINPSLVIGDHAYIGTGAVVVRSIPRHTLAYGSPARAAALVCICRTKLSETDYGWSCGRCGRTYDRSEVGPRLR